MLVSSLSTGVAAMPRLLLRSLVLLVLVAGTAQAQKRGDRSLITRTDIEEAGGGLTTALELVQRLRPNWLRPPMGRNAKSGMLDGINNGDPAPSEPIVYIDEVRQPNVDILRNVRTTKVIEVKYLDQNRAIQMLGPGHESGAILVTTADKR
ncbi:MAG TPA: hypothetical protein VFV33_13915 [Gemmatimonadaceae bacterium]|nr:hypothetical protein [Gemmatimonadaceae bacterium]